jgi:hypothetical protein
MLSRRESLPAVTAAAVVAVICGAFGALGLCFSAALIALLLFYHSRFLEAASAAKA